MDSSRLTGGRRSEPDYIVTLDCPVCGLPGTHRVLRAKEVLSLPVPGRPFLRAFTWTEEIERQQNSPLYYGLCVCLICHYPSVEADFRPPEGVSHPNARSVRKLFVTERAGRQGLVSDLLGPNPELLEEPERSVRVNLAAIRAEMLHYPELWRRAELGRLYLRLAWLYLDQLHFDWNGIRPASPPAYCETGPNAARLKAVLQKLEPLRSAWPEIPVSEDLCRKEALRFHQEVYQLRRQEPEAEDAVHEERTMAVLLGLVGDLDAAREMLDRAVMTSAKMLKRELARQNAPWKTTLFTIAQRRALGARIQRLSNLVEDIGNERKDIFGPPAPPPKPVRLTANKPAPAAQSRTVAPQKKRFGLFG